MENSPSPSDLFEFLSSPALIGGNTTVPAWIQSRALSRREKALIGLAVAHALQCPYCIDAYAQSCLESGSNMEQMTEAIHMGSALRGGAALIHGLQAHNSVDKVSM